MGAQNGYGENTDIVLLLYLESAVAPRAMGAGENAYSTIALQGLVSLVKLGV
jgi:hypothetical protein